MKFKCISKILPITFFFFIAVTSNAAVFTVTQTAGNPWWPACGNAGSLKEAVCNAATNPGRDTIVFDLPGGAVISSVVNPFTLTAADTDLLINGLSVQDGNPVIFDFSVIVTGTDITVKGINFQTVNHSLTITGSDNTVDSCLFSVSGGGQNALWINGGTGTVVTNSVFNSSLLHAISIENGGGHTVDGCTIFNSSDVGVIVRGSGNNVIKNCSVSQGSHNGIGLISGDNSLDSNVVFNNDRAGIVGDNTLGSCSNNTVRYNEVHNNNRVFWMNAGSPTPDQGGIQFDGPSTTIYNNWVYDNAGNGILLNTAAAVSGIVRKNIVGRDKLGNELGNGWNGIFIWEANNSIVDSNVVVNNGKGAAPTGMPDRISGIRFQSVSSGTIRNNFIGTDVNKVVAGNDFDGITLHTGGSNVLIESNVITNNGFSPNYGSGGGIALREASNTNTIRANFIGVHPDDTPAANNDYGISIEGSSNNLIGGDLPVDGNKITGASGRGIWIVIGSNNNEVYSNLIGNTNQTNPSLGNAVGVQIERNSSGNKIGKFGSGNVIAGNGNGIYVHTPTATGNTLRGNSFFCNTNQGILLEDGGNNLYGKPSGTKNVIVNSAEIRSGFISGFAPQNALVDIYVADTICKVNCDATPYQGLIYVTTVNASGAFNADVNGYLWEYDLTDPSNVGGVITKNNVVVLATQSTGTTPNTSEFSVCVPIPQCVPPANVSIIADQSICIGQSTTLRATADSLDRAVDNRYTWYKGSIDPLNEVASNLNDSTLAVSTSDTGLYYVVISNTIDENLCSGSNNTGYVFRANPLPNRTITVGKDTFCTGDSTLVQAVNNPNRTYQWNPNVTSSSSFYANAGGTYKVIITNTTTGCIDSSTVTLTENLLPNINLSASDADFCDGDSVTIDAGLSAGYSFVWNPSGSVSNSIVVKNGGSYKVVVTNTTTGCIDSSSITITENPKATIDLGPDRRLCSNETLTLDAGSGWQSVIWNGDVSESNQTFVVNSGDSLYKVSVVNSNGCEGSDSVYVTSLDIPSISILGGDTILCSKGGATLTAISSYSGRKPLLIEWSNGSSDSTTIISVAPTNLSVSITDSNNCKVSDEILIDEFCEPTIIKLPNVIVVGSETNGYFTPLNPNNEDLANGVLISEVQIYDRWGIKVHESNELLPNWNGEFNNRPVSSGVYFWIWNYTDTSDKEYKLNGFVQVLKE